MSGRGDDRLSMCEPDGIKLGPVALSLIQNARDGGNLSEKQNYTVEIPGVPENCMVRGGVMIEALRVINGERQDVYGSPEDSFALISDYWTTYVRSRSPEVANAGFCLEADDVAMMMTLFKVAREANQHKRDNIVDAAGYLGIYADMQERK